MSRRVSDRPDARVVQDETRLLRCCHRRLIFTSASEMPVPAARRGVRECDVVAHVTSATAMQLRNRCAAYVMQRSTENIPARLSTRKDAYAVSRFILIRVNVYEVLKMRQIGLSPCLTYACSLPQFALRWCCARLMRCAAGFFCQFVAAPSCARAVRTTSTDAAECHVVLQSRAVAPADSAFRHAYVDSMR